MNIQWNEQPVVWDGQQAAWGEGEPPPPPPPPPADLVGLLQIWTGSSWFNVNDGTFQVWTGSEWVLL